MSIEEIAGPKILFIDDVKGDVAPIIERLGDKNLSNLFVDASPEAKKPEVPIKSVQLVFLDLYFSPGTMGPFDPEVCAGLVQKVVPENKQYFLVIFSKDTDRAKDVLMILEIINLLPVKTVVRQKTDYDFKKKSDVDRLLNEVDKEFDVINEVDDVYGEVISIEDNEVIIDCLIDEEEKVFQKRHFDPYPFSNMELSTGKHVVIRTITSLGSITFEFYNTTQDLKDLFSKDNLFNDIDESDLV